MSDGEVSVRIDDAIRGIDASIYGLGDLPEKPRPKKTPVAVVRTKDDRFLPVTFVFTAVSVGGQFNAKMTLPKMVVDWFAELKQDLVSAGYKPKEMFRFYGACSQSLDKIDEVWNAKQVWDNAEVLAVKHRLEAYRMQLGLPQRDLSGLFSKVKKAVKTTTKKATTAVKSASTTAVQVTTTAVKDAKKVSFASMPKSVAEELIQKAGAGFTKAKDAVEAVIPDEMEEVADQILNKAVDAGHDLKVKSVEAVKVAVPAIKKTVEKTPQVQVAKAVVKKVAPVTKKVTTAVKKVTPTSVKKAVSKVAPVAKKVTSVAMKTPAGKVAKVAIQKVTPTKPGSLVPAKVVARETAPKAVSQPVIEQKTSAPVAVPAVGTFTRYPNLKIPDEWTADDLYNNLNDMVQSVTGMTIKELPPAQIDKEITELKAKMTSLPLNDAEKAVITNLIKMLTPSGVGTWVKENKGLVIGGAVAGVAVAGLLTYLLLRKR